jgi:hypothetical protein
MAGASAAPRALAVDLPVVYVVFGRNLAYVILVALIGGGRHAGRLVPSRRPGLQLARGLATAGGPGRARHRQGRVLALRCATRTKVVRTWGSDEGAAGRAAVRNDRAAALAVVVPTVEVSE